MPNTNHNQTGASEQYITQKRIIIDDVNSFFTQYIEAARTNVSMKKEDDLMIQMMSIENELFKTEDEQLCKLLSFMFLILHQLVKTING